MNNRNHLQYGLLAILCFQLGLSSQLLAIGSYCVAQSVVDIRFDSGAGESNVRKVLPTSAYEDPQALAEALEEVVHSTVGSGTLLSSKQSRQIVCYQQGGPGGGAFSSLLREAHHSNHLDNNTISMEIPAGALCQIDSLGSFTMVSCPQDQSEVILDDLGNFVVPYDETFGEEIDEGVNEYMASHMHAIKGFKLRYGFVGKIPC